MGAHLEILRGDQAAVGAEWFAAIAERLLNETDLLIAGEPHRLREVELYYHGPGHEDPFAHRDPVQRSCGRWYFHRDGGSFRGGSFKGLDVSFGPDDAYGGVLIRTIETAEGTQISGCSLCVDHMLARTGSARVADLDGALGARPVDDAGGLLSLRPAEAPRAEPVLATARVGLTLKTLHHNPTMPAFIMRRDRFVTVPAIAKGRVHAVVALHQAGRSPEEILALTGGQRRALSGYLEAYEAGRAIEGFASFAGRALKTADLCRLHGAWWSAFGREE